MINITLIIIIISIIIIAFLSIYLQINNMRKILKEFLTIKSDLNKSTQSQLQEESEFDTRERLLETLISTALKIPYLEQAVNIITEIIGTQFNSDRTAIRLFDPVNNTFLDIIGEYRKNENLPSVLKKGTFTKELDDYLINELFENKRPIIVENMNDPKYPNIVRKTFENHNVQSLIIAPITYNNLPLAIISMTNLEPGKTWSKEDIDLLSSMISKISIAINILWLNKRVKTALIGEQSIRNTIEKIRVSLNPDFIFNYLLNQILEIFNANRVMHLNYNKEDKIYVQNEANKDTNQESLKGQILFTLEEFNNLLTSIGPEIIIANDVDEDIKPDLRNLLISKEIQSFIIYPIYMKLAVEDKSLGIIMMSFSSSRKLSSDEMDLLVLIIDTVSIVYLETLQRQKIEEIKKTFTATLVHDLRSPIIGEQKALEVILSSNPDAPLKNYSEYFKGIYETNDDLLKIINNLLEIYHYESGKSELKIEENNIKDMLDSVVRTLKPLAVDKNSDILLNIQENLPPVMVDKSQIKRVLSNLVSNAIKHNKKDTNITVQAIKTDNEIQVSVSDNGQGIPEAEKPNIFQKYPVIKSGIGSGLGLYLSKQIIDAHGGKIWFESEIGKGTTFLFTLPVA
jgi:signal transduction histidine kinase